MKTKTLLAVAALSLLGGLPQSSAPGTAFTHQGRMADEGAELASD